MVAAAPAAARRPPRGGRRWSVAGALREAARQLLPEPYYKRPYRPPTQYANEDDNGKICWADGMVGSLAGGKPGVEAAPRVQLARSGAWAPARLPAVASSRQGPAPGPRFRRFPRSRNRLIHHQLPTTPHTHPQTPPTSPSNPPVRGL
jgi:hypothetical protein